MAGPLEELRSLAGEDVAVTVCLSDETKVSDLEGYLPLGVERVLLGLPTEPRDQTLRYLDQMESELVQLG